MAYTTEAKVKAMFRGIDIEAADTVITDSTLADFISEADAEIDGKLNAYYVTPITGTEALKIVGKISKLKVAHVIKGILEVTQPNLDQVQGLQGNLDKQADDLLKDALPKWNKGAKRFDVPVMRLTDAGTKDISPISGSVFKSSEHTPTIIKGGNNW